MEQDKKPFHIAICGGGIGGLCLAIGLTYQNVPCTIYEATAAFSEVGAGIGFGPNALRAMALINPAIARGYNKLATRNAFPEKESSWFDFRIGMKEEGWKNFKGGAPAREGELITNVQCGELGQSTAHRAHFLDVLVKLIPEGMAKFGKRVVKVEQKGDRVMLSFEDGSMAEADAVIGCDGIKSRVRQIILGEIHAAVKPVFTGVSAYRGLIPMEEAVAILGDELARNSQMYLGHEAHILTFPIDHGTLLNTVAIHKKKDGKWDHREWIVPTKKEDMLNDYADWSDNLKDLLSMMKKHDLWAFFNHPDAPTYYQGRIAILGDAAHASTPHQGAGAGQAVEDALVLSNLLGQASSAADIGKAFKAYDAVRRPRTQKVVSTSRDACSLFEFWDQEKGSDLEYVKKELNTLAHWIWEEDLDKQIAEAQMIMKSRPNL